MNSAQQQPVRVRVLFFFLELRVHHCALHSVHNSLLLHLANRASFTCKTDSFSWGHGPDALACKARPSSDQCGTSLSVSLSLSLRWSSSPHQCKPSNSSQWRWCTDPKRHMPLAVRAQHALILNCAGTCKNIPVRNLGRRTCTALRLTRCQSGCLALQSACGAPLALDGGFQ